MSNVLTPQLSKAARILLDWSQEDLSLEAGVGLRSISRFEAGKGPDTPVIKQKLYDAFNKGGVQFIAANSLEGTLDGLGVRRKPRTSSDGIKIL